MPSPQLDLAGRVAIVTGASRGIGRAVADAVWRAGATVVANARSIEAADFATLNAERPGSVLVSAGDVSSPGYCRDLVRLAHQSFKRLDILVNNAGIMPAGMLGMTPDADIEAAIGTNLGAALHMMQASARLMMRNKGGSIINLASILGRVGKPGLVAYSAAKAGVIGATLAAAKELAPHQIRVNAVAPGFIETPMTAALDEAVRAQQLAQIGFGRAGAPEEVADAVLFLASDMSRYVTGQVLGVDGAFSP
jgi:3-oxoacyl-[acyl-carrier protein] reductase